MTYCKSKEIYTKIYWLFTTLMLLTAMPLGVVLIVVKLVEPRKKRRAAVFCPAPDAPCGAQTTRCGDPCSAQEMLETASGKMRRRTGLGLILSILCAGLLAVCAMNGINLWTSGWCVFVSLYYMLTGLQALFAVRRFRDYAAAMGNQPVMSLAALAAKNGLSEKQIRADMELLEFMELVPGFFLDRERALLFCL